MNIHGFYKLTLLDYPEHMACSIFTGGCNLRCPFCHNASLVTHVDANKIIPTDTILSFLETRVGILEGVCITGGEPTLQSDLKEFIKTIKAMGFLVKLDTNGTNPDLLQELLSAKLLDYVAMDIKNSLTKYAKTVGIKDFDCALIQRSVQILKESMIPYEFRTTVVKELHTYEDFIEIAELIGDCDKYYIQNFVDSGDLVQPGMTGYSKQQMIELIKKVRQLIPNVESRGIE